MVNITKVSEASWIKGALNVLIKDGINGVKVDRLSKLLGVSRGSFYHHFENRQALINRLIEEWVNRNNFLPEKSAPLTHDNISDYFNKMIDHHIASDNFDPSFEMAVREWGRLDPDIQSRIEAIDEKRMAALSNIFIILGYNIPEAEVRSRVFYLHQIGYYSLGLHDQEAPKERKQIASIYMSILCGPKYRPS